MREMCEEKWKRTLRNGFPLKWRTRYTEITGKNVYDAFGRCDRAANARISANCSELILARWFIFTNYQQLKATTATTKTQGCTSKNNNNHKSHQKATMQESNSSWSNSRQHTPYCGIEFFDVHAFGFCFYIVSFMSTQGNSIKQH